eukprot:scaffold16761_cov142-Isochrysis_galbana.AAC.5
MGTEVTIRRSSDRTFAARQPWKTACKTSVQAVCGFCNPCAAGKREWIGAERSRVDGQAPAQKC